MVDGNWSNEFSMFVVMVASYDLMQPFIGDTQRTGRYVYIYRNVRFCVEV